MKTLITVSALRYTYIFYVERLDPWFRKKCIAVGNTYRDATIYVSFITLIFLTLHRSHLSFSDKN